MTHYMLFNWLVYLYSCQIQYDFTCPTGQANCQYFSQVFQSGIFNSAMSTTYPNMYSTQLRVKKTTSHLAMVFNGTNIQVDAYLFSSEVVKNVSDPTTGDTPQYNGKQNFAKKFSWTNLIQVTKNCDPTIIKITENGLDTNAEVSKNLSATAIVNQDPASSRIKKIIQMDISDTWNKQHCLADFNVFILRSKQLSDQFSAMFSFTNPQQASVNPTISLVAAANRFVSSPTCVLSTQTQLNKVPPPTTINYTKSCEFVFQVEAKIGTLSFGTYTEFKFIVKNECYAIDVSKAPTTYSLWNPSPTQTLPFTYEIWHGAQPLLYSLPKPAPKLPSEFLNMGYPTASQECGSSFDYSLLSPPVFATISVTQTADFPAVQILSTDPSDSGQTSLNDFKRLYHLSLSAVFSSFSDGPIFVYDATKQTADPALDFHMQDRCIGMSFDHPFIISNTTDRIGNRQKIKETLSTSTHIELHALATDYIQIERITPNLFSPAGQALTKADGRCGSIQYYPRQNARFADLVTWESAQINPISVGSVKNDMQFILQATASVGIGDYSFEVCAGSAYSPLYAIWCFLVPIRVYPCYVLSVSQSGTRQDFMLISGGPQVDLKIAALRQEPSCGYQWVYTLTTLAIKDMNDSIDFDTLVLQSPKVEGTSPAILAALNQQTVTFRTDSLEIVGRTYATFVTARLITSSIQEQIKRNFELARFKIEPPTMTIPKNTPPTIKSLVDYFEVQPGQKSQLLVGSLSDYESPKNITLIGSKVHCEDGTSDWVSLPPLGEVLTKLQISVDVPQTANNTTCLIDFTASDNDWQKPMQLTQKIIIAVSTSISEEQAIEETLHQKTEEEIQRQKEVSDLLSRLYPLAKQSNKFIKLPLILGPKKVSSSGVLTLAFNRPVQLNVDYFFEQHKGRKLEQVGQSEKEWVNQVLRNAFTIEYRPKQKQLESMLLDYTVLDFRKAQEIDIQLNFNEPLYVSFFAELSNQLTQDTLVLSLKDAQIFVDPNINTPITPALLQKEIVAVPRQEAAEKSPVTKLTQVTTEAMVKVLVPSTLVINILLGVSLKKLWSAVNLLQFVTYVNLWRVSLPSNLQNFIYKASFFARGDWIPKEHIMGFLHVKPKSTEDKQALQTRFLIILLVGLTILTISVIGLIFACKTCNAKIVLICRKIKQQIFWNAIIRYSIQSYLDFAITISLAVAIRNGTSKPKLGIYSCLLLLIAVAPAGYVILLRKKFPQLRSQEMRLKIGTLYQGINVRRFSAACYNVAFLVRRIIYATITAFVGSFDGGLTVTLVVIELVVFSVYIVTVKPQETQAGNHIELASEILLTHFFFGMMVCMCTEEPKQQYFVAWLSVAAIAILVMLCVGFLASDSVVKLIQWIKKKLVIRRRLAELERRNQEEALARQQITEVRVVMQQPPQLSGQKNVQSTQPQAPAPASRYNPDDFFVGKKINDPNYPLSSDECSVREYENEQFDEHQVQVHVDQAIKPEDSIDEQFQLSYDIEDFPELHNVHPIKNIIEVQDHSESPDQWRSLPETNHDKELHQQPVINEIKQKPDEESKDEIFVSSYGNERIPSQRQASPKDDKPKLKDKFSWKELWVEDSATRSLNRRYFEAMDLMEKETIRINEQNRFRSNTINQPGPD